MSAAEIWDLVSKGGIVGFLLFILWGGQKPNPIWVFGSQHREKVKEAEEWKKIALTGMGISKRATDAATWAAKLAEVAEMLEGGKDSDSGKQ